MPSACQQVLSNNQRRRVVLESLDHLEWTRCALVFPFRPGLHCDLMQCCQGWRCGTPPKQDMPISCCSLHASARSAPPAPPQAPADGAELQLTGAGFDSGETACMAALRSGLCFRKVALIFSSGPRSFNRTSEKLTDREHG